MGTHMSDTKEEQRAPLLSDEDIDVTTQPFPSTEHERIAARWGMRQARYVYEGLITSGELRVVKKAKYVQGTLSPNKHCSECGRQMPHVYYTTTFCPGCGAQITNE